ncbi:unnamed protein product [Soboliphyme baturini]|uniref:Glycine N-acyltransferase-like protein n=1 Tax=Soboliphyme baturini TaxID=241478 RepID=A0A183ILG8_9BILA|nr:unnamed protein product [Soboliphyme baturini]
MVVEVVSTENRETALNILMKQNDPYSLVVRGMIQNVLNGTISEGQVFSDSWPNFRNIVCLHDSREYSNFDTDFVTWHSTTVDDFALFFPEMVAVRRWKQRGFIMHYVRSDFADIILAVMRLSPSELQVNTFQLCVAGKEHEEKMAKLQRKRAEAIQQLPPGFKVDKLYAYDAEYVSQMQSRKMPDKVNYYRWLLKKFPTQCVRNEQGQPIAFSLTYDSGAAGGLYVDPEYRRRGLSLLVEVSPDKTQMPVPFGAVAFNNQRSKNLQIKYFGIQILEQTVSWIIYCPYKEMEEINAPKSKI